MAVVILLAGIFSFLLPQNSVLARDVSFIWSPNPETVDGYRIYYKTGSSGPPYNGTGTVEGPSPVAAGNVTSFTLHGLSDTETYYFALTAYIGSLESAYSTELTLPANTPPVTTRTISFVWMANPETVDGYKLYYEDIPVGSSCPQPSTVPYNSVDATAGPSPINTGNVTTYTVQGLSFTKTYCFALTAFRGTVESAYTQPIQLTGNNPPVTTDALVTTYKDTAVNGQLAASDPNGDALTFSIVTNGTKGVAAVSNAATGAFTYTPNTNVTGSDTFTFKANDGKIDSNTATVSVTISTINSAPVATGGFFVVDENTTATGQLLASDPDGDALTYGIVTNGTKGVAKVTNAATGAFTYTPNTNATGSDSFTFRVSDGTVDSNTATITVTINAVNVAPVATGASITVNKNKAYSGKLTATDGDGDALTYSIVSNGTKGTAAVTSAATGAFTYTPNTNATGSDSFTFRANDGTVNSNTATITVSIVNTAPVATGASITTDENKAYSGTLSATDADGDALTYGIVSNGTKGTAAVTNQATGAFTYTPNTNATGSDSFTFRVNDGTVNSNTATVSVTINVVNVAPVATGASITVSKNKAYSGTLSATDGDGDALTFSIVSNGTKGTAAVTSAATGAFTYTPNTNATGSDSFTFRANDGTVNSNTATITVSIVNTAPVATGASITTDKNKAFSGTLSATDGDGDALTYSIVSNGTKGTAAVTSATTGAFTYTPNTNATGSDSFTFRVSDGTVNSNTATITVTINAVNVAPVATGAAITTDENKAYSGTLSATDGDGDALTYSIVTNGTKGVAAVTNAATGAFTYTPNTNATGGDSFTFRVSDGTVNSNTATVTVTINAVNVAPVASADFISTDVDMPVNGQMLASDPDGDTLSHSIVTNGTKGVAAVTNAATGAFTYTPNPQATGDDTFTFKVNDGTVDSNTATVSVLVKDGATVAAVFGDTPDADYPGTVSDTFANINTDTNAAALTLSARSWSSAAPHKVASTIILKADLTGIPAGATILDARLYLYQTAATGEVEYSTSVHRITGKNPLISQVTGYNAFNGEPWTPVPAGTTYNNIPLGLADIGAKEEALLLDTLSGYRSWHVTSMVQEWVKDPATNFGLLLQGVATPTETGRSFAASENQNANIRPKLVVQYTLRPPAPKLILIEEIK